MMRETPPPLSPGSPPAGQAVSEDRQKDSQAGQGHKTGRAGLWCSLVPGIPDTLSQQLGQRLRVHQMTFHGSRTEYPKVGPEAPHPGKRLPRLLRSAKARRWN